MSHEALRGPDAGGFVHDLLVYGSTDELVTLAAPFVRDGVRDGDGVAVISTRETLASVHDALPPDEAAAVTFEPSQSRYTAAGPTLSGLQRLLEEHTASGRRVRVLAEPPLTAMDRRQRRALCHNDIAFNEVASVPGASVVCLADARTAPADALMSFRRSHPATVEGGERRPSPEFVDPVALLSQELGAPLPPPPADAAIAEFPAPADAAEARAFVHHALEDVLDEEPRSDFVAAVNEIVANAFSHAVMDRLRLWRDTRHVVCEVGDGGEGISDPLAGYRQPSTDQASGWGLWIARHLTDVVEVRTGAGGTTVRLHADLGGDRGAASGREAAGRSAQEIGGR